MFEKKNETQNCPVLHTHTYTHKKKPFSQYLNS